jgi:predicted ATP-dependent endonuclease of OLD family
VRIRSVVIDDILATRHAEFNPGTLTTITGANRTGKTSILDAFKRCFEGGSDPDLLRKGAKFGAMTLTLSDGRKVKMRVTAKATTYEVENAAGEPEQAPQALIAELADSLSVDPARLLTAKPKELADVLLEVMPISFTREEFNSCIVGDCFAESATDGRNGAGMPALSLEEMEARRAQIYEVRTHLNRELRQA